MKEREERRARRRVFKPRGRAYREKGRRRDERGKNTAWVSHLPDREKGHQLVRGNSNLKGTTLQAGEGGE